MATPYSRISKKVTPQSEPIFGSGQVENTAGGYAWALDDWKQLDRFLILGSEGGTYYITEQALTLENAEAVLRCIKADGAGAVARIREISTAGRAPKNDPALFALALCFAYGNHKTKRMAAAALPHVARIGTHLFHFAEYVKQHRGWGRLLRNAVANWYLTKEVDDLAYQVVKYRQRDGWTHRDLLRLSHPLAESGPQNALFNWVVGKRTMDFSVLPRTIQGADMLAELALPEFANVHGAAQLVTDYRLPMECVPSELVGFETWNAALPHLGLTALIRNLGNLSRHGVLSESKPGIKKDIVARLTDETALSKARIHPIQVLAALITYGQGHGSRGKGEWGVIPDVIDALDEGFYKAFGNVQPSGKRLLLGLDVSDSMGITMTGGIPGLTCRLAAAAMAMVTWKVEKDVVMCKFDTGFKPVDISRRTTLAGVVEATSAWAGGGTDCALPMIYALKNRIPIDTFIVYTDNETWAGRIHPSQALQQYRREMGIPARLIVVGMASNSFSIADPKDAGMLDVVGFDTSTPEIIRAFSAGEL